MPWKCIHAGTESVGLIRRTEARDRGSLSSSFSFKALSSVQRPCFAVVRGVFQVCIHKPSRWEPQEMWNWQVVWLEFVSRSR